MCFFAFKWPLNNLEYEGDESLVKNKPKKKKKKNTYEAEKDSENSSGLLFNSNLEKKHTSVKVGSNQKEGR